MSEEDKEIIEEIEEETEESEPETTLTAEEETAEEIEDMSEDTDEEPIESLETMEEEEYETSTTEEEESNESEEELEVEEPIEEEAEIEAEELDVPESDKELEEEELKIPEIPLEIESLVEEEEEEFTTPEIPLEEEITDVEPLEEVKVEPSIEEEEIKEAIEKRPPQKKRKRSPSFLLGLFVGLIIALATEVLFSLPAWIDGVSRPDLYYIELVIILIAMMIPGLFSRSILKGILGGFIIFAVSFALPLALIPTGYILLGPLSPLFYSTDFALTAYDVFSSLFAGLDGVPFEQIQKWIWVIDLFMMFILTLIVVTFSTWLIKNITLPKKKVRHWVGIPIISLGLIIFAIFVPIFISSTYGIIQASTSFLAGTTRIQDAYGSFEGSGGAGTAALEPIQDLIIEANYWMNISQSNYNGLRNIGIISVAILVSGQYGPLIEAGDQLALSTLALTNILYPLFSGIFDLTQSLTDATDSMANFGESTSSAMKSTQPESVVAMPKTIGDVEQLKEDLLGSIEGLEAAQVILSDVNELIAEQDFAQIFDSVKSTLGALDLDKMPDAVGNVVDEIYNKIDQFKDQITGFVDFISYSVETIEPTKHLLFTSYNTIVGNEYLRNYNFTAAKVYYNYALDNISAIGTLAEFNPTTLSDVFAVELGNEYSAMQRDLLYMMEPLLEEKYAFADTYEIINAMISDFAGETNIAGYDYGTAPVVSGIDAQTYGFLAQDAVDLFKANISADKYGSFFTNIGVSFDKIFSDDFRPEAFGNITAFMGDVSNFFLLGCEAYTLQDFAGAEANLSLAEDLMTTNILPTLQIDDPAFYTNYLNNWSLTIANMKIAMQTYNTPIDMNDGYIALQIYIVDLFIKTEATD
ncbi:MAG: hypothetical protein FK734_16190 [Asgard group archaeon]|nr:hypothetical protein [Asgard group archaeon]